MKDVDLNIDSTYSTAPQAEKPLIVACGAIARELIAVLNANQAEDKVEIQCLPAIWHNRPELIPDGVKDKIEAARRVNPTRNIFVAYADCGSGGMLDVELEKYPGIKRLPGAHCYAFFSGLATFDAMMDEEIGTFFLTDYLARHFKKLIWDGMGLTKHPDLKDMIFGHYSRVVYLAQITPPPYITEAQQAADLICDGNLKVVETGYGLVEQVIQFAEGGA